MNFTVLFFKFYQLVFYFILSFNLKTIGIEKKTHFNIIIFSKGKELFGMAKFSENKKNVLLFKAFHSEDYFN
jgi:hypothetical protein